MRRKRNFDWTSLFMKDSGGFSSKRVLSFLGFITCIIIFIIAFITEKDVPDFGDTLLICCVSLYGVEIGTNWYSKSINKS